MKCQQPGCTGTIVDGYCDVCGMAPADGSPGLVTGASAPSSTNIRPGDMVTVEISRAAPHHLVEIRRAHV